MEGSRRPFFRKQDSPQFKRKGESQRGKWPSSSREQPSGSSHPSDTVYQILCPSKRIGSVIGKGGSIVKALREDTKAKITVADPIPGSDERVIIIYSPPEKISQKHKNDGGDPATNNEEVSMEPHCPAQDALLKVHDRIIEEDLVDDMEDQKENEIMVTVRLLVPNNLVGCILGKKGDVIQRLRNETGASIRVLPANQIPTCAMSTDELVQVSGKPKVVKGALYEVSTLLHQNPRKDNPPSGFPMPRGGQGFHPLGPPLPSMHSPGNPMWSQRKSNPHDMLPMPWMGDYGNQPSGFGPGGFDDEYGDEVPSEFSMKILCPSGKIGGVIGKGGVNVKQLQQDTGAGIHVEDASAESEERVIRISSFEVPRDPRSQTIEAILLLQNKTSEHSEKGITTRLLVPSSKVGCLLGQGGHVINDMRRRTQADIRVYNKEDKPKCAADDEEVVQISGNFDVAKDALAEIASRLKARCLRDANGRTEPPMPGPRPEFAPPGRLSGRGPRSPGPMRPGGSYRRFDDVKVGGHEYEPPGYRVPPSAAAEHEYDAPSYRGPPPSAAAGYSHAHSSYEMKIPNNAGGRPYVGGTGGSNFDEFAGSRVKYEEPHAYRSENHGYSGHLNATTQNVYPGYGASSGQSAAHYPHGIKSPPPPMQNMNTSHQHHHQQQQPIYQEQHMSRSEQGPYHSTGDGQSSHYQY